MRYFFVIVGFLFVGVPTNSASRNFEEVVEQTMKKHGIPKSDFGFSIGSSKLEYSLNSNKKFVPASVTKVLVAGAMLDRFEKGAQFNTELQIGGNIEGSRLKGTLYLKGGGDPSFTSERLWYLVNEFWRLGVRQIDGDIVVDDSVFDDQRVDPGRDDTRVDRAYDALLSGMSFNWNSVNVYVRSGKSLGSSASVFIDPENDYIKLKGKVVTKGSRPRVKVSRKSMEGRDKIQVSGSIPLGSQEKVIYKNVSFPSLWSGYNLKEFLRQRGVLVKGVVRLGRLPGNSQVVAVSPGATVQELVSLMMKFSNNFIAESLTKHLSIVGGASRGNIQGGVTEMRSHLREMGVNTDAFKISSVSGLSRKNKFEITELWKLLNEYRNSFKIGPEFIASLPVSGMDGTLKNRLNGRFTRGRIRAKTGLLTGAVALAGYMQNRNDIQLPFAMIYNGSKKPWDVQVFFDDLLTRLIQL